MRTALVTASSKGIGFAISEKLLAEGYKVIISSSNEANLAIASDKLRVKGYDNFESIICNLRDEKSVAYLIHELNKRTNGIDILVNNCGGPVAGYFPDLKMSDWDQAHQEILKSALVLMRGFLPGMKSNKWGRIVNITSASVKQYIENLILSTAYRTALVSASKVLSIQYAADNITFNNIAPGYTRTERITELIEFRAKKQGVSFETALSELTENTPMKRLAEPEEIAHLVNFIISEEAGYITGNTITVDGGLTKSIY